MGMINGLPIWYCKEEKTYVYGSGVFFKTKNGDLSEFVCYIKYDISNKDIMVEELKRLDEWTNQIVNGGKYDEMIDLRFLQKRFGKVEIS